MKTKTLLILLVVLLLSVPSVNASLTSQFMWEPDIPQPGETVMFNASTSAPNWDPVQNKEIPIAKYLWNFGDEIIDEGMTVTHAYERSGSYTVTLKLIDEEGNSVEQSIAIDVKTDNEKLLLPAISVVAAVVILGVGAFYLMLKNRKRKNDGG